MSATHDPDDALRRQALSPVLRSEEFAPLSATVRVEFGAQSSAGSLKRPNEDHYLIVRLGRSQETVASTVPEAEAPRRFSEYGYAMLVASGAGESGAGGIASRIAINTLVHLAVHYGRWNVRVDTRTAFEIIERLEWCYGQADETVRQKSHTNRFLRGMSTTLTAAYSAGDELFIVHAGDSRAYIFRAGQLQHLATEESARTDASSTTPPGPRLVSRSDRALSSAISDTLGGAGKLQISVGRYQLQDGDILMICTDPLMSSLGRERIADVLMERRRPDELCRMLVSAAAELKASPENVTMLLAHYRIPKGLA